LSEDRPLAWTEMGLDSELSSWHVLYLLGDPNVLSRSYLELGDGSVSPTWERTKDIQQTSKLIAPTHY